MAPRQGTSIPIYPVALAATYVLAKFLESWAPIEIVVRPMVVVLAAVSAVLAIAALVLGRHRGAWIVAVVAMLLVEVPAALVLVVAVPVVLGVESFRNRRLAPVPWHKLTPLFNAISVIALAVTLVQGVAQGAFYVGAERSSLIDMESPPEAAPDIYLVLLDAHPRQDTMRDVFGVDSTEFNGWMESHGFELADQAHSNYNNTPLTLSSMFNAALVPDLMPNPPDGTAAQARLINRLINDGAMLQKLREYGYEIDALQSEIGYVSMFAADRVIDTGTLTEFELGLTQEDAIQRMDPSAMFDFVLAQHRERVLESFKAVRELAGTANARPRFVFAHILAPHPPIVFSADGSPVKLDGCLWTACSLDSPMTEAQRALVAGQLTYVDEQVGQTASAIIDRSHRPAVVVFFSDHGFRLHRDDDDHTEWFRTFLISRTPGKPDLVPADATPINLLARILNGYLDAGIPLADEGAYERPKDGPTNGFFPLLPFQPS